jgi:2-polyprenyl-6-methoxyphenol hydroxylase-like FAD-dependent oxidoreductase
MSTQQDELKTAASGRKMDVLISGASFAGLATAFWMRKMGYAVTVVEVAANLRKGGTPVDIREDVVEVVKRMGLLERIAAHSLKDRAMQFFDGSGRPVAVKEDKGGQANGGEWGEQRQGYEIERDDLLDMLFDEVKGDVTFLFGESISEMKQSAEAVDVRFSSGMRRSFAMVLGCDGTHSAVRKMCFGEETSFLMFMQNYFSLAIVDKLLIEEDTAQMFNVAGKTVMLNAYNKKTDIAFCFFSERPIDYDRRNREEQREMVRDQFKGEAWRIGELLEEVDRCDNFYFDQLCQIRMGAWSKGRVALVGDAAYCPSPAAGMGGSMAILGAAALADAMKCHPEDIGKAFQAYDEGFRPIVERIQADAVEAMAMFMPRTEEAIQKRNMQLIGRLGETANADTLRG